MSDWYFKMADSVLEIAERYFRMADSVFEMVVMYFKMADCQLTMAECTISGQKSH